MPARPRAGGGHRHEAHAARPRDLHDPGRRRHGVGGPRRGAAHRGARRVDHLHPPQQRRVRRHRRPDDRDHHRRPAHEDRRRRAGARTQHGYPIPIADIVAQLPGVAYVARGAVDRPNAVSRTRRYLREAFESQLAGEGFSLVEILTMCPTGWSVPADQGAEYQRDQRNPPTPLGELRAHADAWTSGSTTSSPAAATVAPARVRRDPRRRATDLRRARRRLQPGRAPAGGRGRRAVGPVVWWGPTDLAALDVCYGVTQARRRARADQSRTSPRAKPPPRSSTSGPRVVVAHPELRRAGAGRSPRALGLPVVVTSPTVARRRGDRAAAARRRRGGSVGDLPHQRVDRRRQGRAALAPRDLAARGRARSRGRARRDATARS